MDYVKVKDKDHLLRDVYSNGIVNNDSDGYQNYVENYKRAYNESKKIKDLEFEMSEIKNDLHEIKTLLRSMINESR
jgi:hypothetical protein